MSLIVRHILADPQTPWPLAARVNDNHPIQFGTDLPLISH
jgi:hypothetical protein